MKTTFTPRAKHLNIRTACIALLLLGTASPLAAQDLTDSPPTAERSTLEQDAEFICDSKAKISDKLYNACVRYDWPKKLKDGSRFQNVGIGAELNTLIRNIHLLAEG